MKTDLNTSSSLPQTKSLPVKGDSKLMGKGAPNKDAKLLAPTPDYKLDLMGKPVANGMTSPGVYTPPSIPSPSVSSLSTPHLSAASPVEDVAKDVVEEVAKSKIKDEVKAHKVKPVEEKNGSIKNPAIFFIKGLDIFSSPSKSEGGYAGMGRIAEAVEGSRLYGWDQKSDMIKEIRKVHPDYPVILVGHSLGGDTAVEIADELDSLQENFRSVDLLVTIDAIGFNHDIIPQNVKEHLNIFGESSWILKDGPHVARREENTNVRNILSPLDHTEIDDDKKVQYEIVNIIQKTLGSMKA